MLNSKWWEGPIWLKETPESWSVSEVSSQPSEVDIERRKCKIVNMNLTEDTPPWYAERASDYDKMIRVFAWVLRFINNCKLVNGKCKNNELSQSEFESSEKKLICLVQSQYLSNAKFLNSVITFVNNEGILRVKTKISNRDDERSFLYPILLPDKCEFTKLKEYLGQLVQKHNEKQSRNPQIGEIVLIGDDNKKRLFWPLAKIIELIPGRDGKIRTVKLKTQHGTVLCPIQRIYPLEIYSKESVDGELGGEESNSNNVTDNENNVASANAVIVRKFTSSGRPVKAPSRLDLLNNGCYTLVTLSESQNNAIFKTNETASEIAFFIEVTPAWGMDLDSNPNESKEKPKKKFSLLNTQKVKRKKISQTSSPKNNFSPLSSSKDEVMQTITSTYVFDPNQPSTSNPRIS
ncbi:DUF5641 domain-containing protein [Nephila pilipes]|uniref:DUF5641 domain-containing protein n=1 Tax=Nephila pilipes TaxID=299642 RepID=A0A8X6PMQ2_NEPPI|nr:DUF5641 domain-containing protein [Nephila pilipes]